MLDKFKRDKLHLAELKYFDMQNNGIELSEPASYVVVYEIEDGKFLNALDPFEELPTFERIPCTTNIYGGQDYYGSKIRVLTDNYSTGPCWLLCDEKFRRSLPGMEIPLSEIENYVLDSSLYFKDRLDIAKKRLRKFEQPFKMARIVRCDKEKEGCVEEFFRIRNNDRRREYIKK